MDNRFLSIKRFFAAFPLVISCLIICSIFYSCKKSESTGSSNIQPTPHAMDLNLTGSFKEDSYIDTNDDWTFPYILSSGGIAEGTIANVSINMNMELSQTIRKDGLILSKLNMAETSNIKNAIVFENININFGSLTYINGVAVFNGICIVSEASGKYQYQRKQEFKISGAADRNNKRLQIHLAGTVFF